MERFAGVLVGALASVLVAGPLKPDPFVQPVSETVRASRGRSDGALVKKGEGEERGACAPLLGTLVNVHSWESLALDEDLPSAEGLSALLEDRAMRERVVFDPRLLETIRALATSSETTPAAGPDLRIEIVSGYRSAKLNERLRKKGRHVASHSQHSLGHAIDFRLGETTPKQVRKRLEQLRWDGGVGQYDAVTDRFIHLDVGKKRRWLGH